MHDNQRTRALSAIRDLESFIVANPGNFAAHFRLGQAYHEAGERQRALDHLSEAVRLNPADRPARKMLADFQYVELSDLESAITNYVRIIEQDPRDVDTLTILGNIALSMSRFEEAKKFYSAVAHVEPWNSEVRTILEAIVRRQREGPAVPTYQAARGLAEQGNTDEALQALEQIVAADPRHALAHNDLGVLYGSRRNAELALPHARAAVEAEPDNLTARKNLADLYQSVLHEPEEAMQQYLEVLRRDPADIETLLAIGSLCIHIGKLEEARTFFSMVLARQPGHEVALDLMRRLGPEQPADHDAMPELFADPRIDEVLREKERYAREYLTDVLRQEPGNRSARRGLEGLGTAASVESRYAEATRLAAEGNAVAALETLQEIVRMQPAFAPALNDLAVLESNPEQARQLFARALMLDPGNLTYKKNLADLFYVKLENAEEAMRLYVSILEKTPRDPETLLAVGILCAEQGQLDDARSFLNAVLAIEPGNEPARMALRTLQAA